MLNKICYFVANMIQYSRAKENIEMTLYVDKIEERINNTYSNQVFSANDFLDIASNVTVRGTLNRLANENKIKRMINGFYYKANYNELLDDYEAVSIHELALAIARKYNWNIAPYNSTALNLLGLSTQVPSHYKYISSGRYKEYNIGDTILEFKKVSPGEIANMSIKTATVIQAIKSLGKDNITDDVILKIRKNLSVKEKEDLLRDAKSTSSWIYEVIRKICVDKNE